MGLEDLNEKLHGRDVHLNRGEQHTPFDPGRGTSDTNIGQQFEKTEEWRDPVQQRPSPVQELMFADISVRKRRRKIALVLGGIAALILLGGLVFKVRSMLFGEGRVEIAVAGPKNVASAEETVFTITYTNKNWAGLDNATLVLSYPDSFHPEPGDGLTINGALAEAAIGKIKASSNGKVIVKGKFYGSRGDVAYLRATLRYTPSGVASVFEKTAQFGVNVASSPLLLEITAPLELATGQDVEYVIDYGNESDASFSNVRLKMEYPEGFHYVSAEPKASEGDTIWYIGNLNTHMSGKIVIRGVISGARAEYKHVKGKIGYVQGDGNFVAYAENERQTKMIASPLSISQTVNGLTDISAGAGDILLYELRYKNEGEIGLRDVIITLDIDPQALDMSRILLHRGVYDATRKMIVWKASDIPGLSRLEPGAGGEITFSVPVAKTFAVGEKNFSIRSVAKIDSPDIPTSIGSNKIIGSNTLYVRLNSLVTLGADVLYEDAVFPNTGPVPPKVGQETSYTVHLSVANSTNDIKQSRISVVLPTDIRYGGTFSPSSETATFNERANELVWELGTFAPTGTTPRELVFQVKTIPSPNQVGKPIGLISKMTFSGKDAFTGQDIGADGGAADNFLKKDKTYGVLGNNVEAAD